MAGSDWENALDLYLLYVCIVLDHRKRSCALMMYFRRLWKDAFLIMNNITEMGALHNLCIWEGENAVDLCKFAVVDFRCV